MFDTQHSKRLETNRASTAPAQKSSNPKQSSHQQTEDLTRIPVYTQAWSNQPPPWLRLPTPQQQTSHEVPIQRQVNEESQDNLAPQPMNEPLPVPVQKNTHSGQRVEAVQFPVYTQAWGNQPPPWLRLPVQRQAFLEGELPRQEGDTLPVQRKENTTGLPDALKTGVENLSGLSMDDVQVHYNSAEPAQVQALAYTQGTEIHVGPGQERHLPHEVWHAVQQMQRRVQPTLQSNGVAINNDRGLEREADAMGIAALGSVSSHPSQILEDSNKSGMQGSTSTVMSKARGQNTSYPTVPPIQRAVGSFEAETEVYDPPTTDLILTLNHKKFQQPAKLVDQMIRAKLNDPLVKAIEVPIFVSALLNKGGMAPKRKPSRSGNIGLIGRDEFFIKSGQGQEAFEGGHLIPHALWEAGDPQEKEADGYRNLVPMSRSVNVIDWADNENFFQNKLNTMTGDELKVDIDVKHQPYEVSLGWIARLFDLTLAKGVDPNERVKLYGWIPTVIEASWMNIFTGSEDELAGVEENQLRTYRQINTKKDFIDVLQETPIWNRMTESLRKKVNGIK